MTRPTPPAPSQVWRVTPWGRLALYAAVLAAALLGAVGVAVAVTGPPFDVADLAVPAVCWGEALVFWRIARHSAMQLTDDAVVVRNVFGRREVLLTDLVAVEPGYYGLTLHTRDGNVCTAIAVQKANLWTWLGRRRRADLVADTVRRAAGLTPAAVPDASPQRSERTPSR